MGTASAGTAGTAARSDHVHPIPAITDVVTLGAGLVLEDNVLSASGGTTPTSNVYENVGEVVMSQEAINADFREGLDGCIKITVTETSDSNYMEFTRNCTNSQSSGTGTDVVYIGPDTGTKTSYDLNIIGTSTLMKETSVMPVTSGTATTAPYRHILSAFTAIIDDDFAVYLGTILQGITATGHIKYIYCYFGSTGNTPYRLRATQDNLSNLIHETDFTWDGTAVTYTNVPATRYSIYSDSSNASTTLQITFNIYEYEIIRTTL